MNKVNALPDDDRKVETRRSISIDGGHQNYPKSADPRSSKLPSNTAYSAADGRMTASTSNIRSIFNEGGQQSCSKPVDPRSSKTPSSTVHSTVQGIRMTSLNISSSRVVLAAPDGTPKTLPPLATDTSKKKAPSGGVRIPEEETDTIPTKNGQKERYH